MTDQATIDALVQSITVAAPIETAFDVFTKGFDSWWPRSHHIGKAELAEAIIEGREGGRWYERGVDGSECEWGRVIAWDPPRRVTLSWHLNGEWEHVADPAKASEVEVTFSPEGPGRTRVVLTHRNLERHGDSAAKVREGVSSDGGWAGLLRTFAEAAEKA